MAKLAAQLKSKFFGLVGRITVCGRAGHKDAAGKYHSTCSKIRFMCSSAG
jgi:hypothetical protein